MNTQRLIRQGGCLALLAVTGLASAQITVDGRRNEPNNSNPYMTPLAVQRTNVINFETAPRVNLCFQSNQSNVGGKGPFAITGTISAPDESDPALVTTGVEYSVRLADIGINPIPTSFNICVLVNGSGHDFLSNQVSGGLQNDPGNLGEIRNVNFQNLPGNQFVTVNTTTRSSIAPTIDGVRTETAYTTFPQVTVGSGFGSSNRNPARRNRANGSEINNISAYIYNNATPGNPNDDLLVFHVAGNLETNFNKLDCFIDWSPLVGQQTLLRNNPDVDFNGLNRMGENTDGTNPANPGAIGPGLTFDLGFRADYWISITCGGGNEAQNQSPSIFVNSAVLLGAGGGPGAFGGSGLNEPTAGLPVNVNLTAPGGTQVPAISVDIDNSNSDAIVNSGGVGGRTNAAGSGSQPDVSPPASVVTGFEFKVNLDGIGYTVGSGNPLRVAGALLGFNYDFMSNNAIGGLTSMINPDPNNLGFPAQAVNFNDWLGNQFVSVNVPGSLPAATGHNINGTLDAAEASLYGAALWVNTTNGAGFGDSVASMSFTPGPNRSNGSELNAAYFYVANDPTDGNRPKLFGLITGNLHDFNKLILFADTVPGAGQNDIRADNAAVENFNNGLGGVDGFRFDDGFEADYAIIYTAGFDSQLNVGRHFALGLPLRTDGGGLGGSFGGGDKTNTNTVCGTVIAREGFGNNNLPGTNPPGGIRTVNANGSELDAAYMRIFPNGNGGGLLYMFIAGNLEPNLTSIEVFFDTRPGDGQNRLIYSQRSAQDPLYEGNPDTDFGALNRMGGPVLDEMGMVIAEGLRFDSAFAPDYWLSFRANTFDPTLNQVTIFGNHARLRNSSDPVGPLPDSADRYLGSIANDAFDTNGPAFLNGDAPEPVAAAALANNNTGGVPGSRFFYCPGNPAGTDPATVVTGFEYVIDLADLGFGPNAGQGQIPYVAGSSQVNFMVFLNGLGHANVSNQILPHACVNDLGEIRNVNFETIDGNQYVGFPVAVPAAGTCTAPDISGDANNDGSVNFSDITSVLTVFGSSCSPNPVGCNGDANNDGVVNFSDVTSVLIGFGNSLPPC